MTNAELLAKLQAEIDKLYGEYKDKFHQCGDQYHLGLIDGLDMAERVLDTLESEYLADAHKTSPKGLEEAANNYLDGVYGKMPHSDLHIAIFIAGAKWQYQKDREEFAKIKAKTWCEGFDACKEQMVENALHGWLDEDNEPPYDLNVHCEEKIPFGEFKHCDKIRIIIMKEDEK